MGIFIIAFLAGSSIPMPLSYVIVTFTFGGILNPASVGAASGLGAGIGGTLVYLFGRGGRRFFPKVPLFSADVNGASASRMSRILDWAQRRGSIVVFLMSAVLNPLFAPMAITIGALRFRLAKFFLMCWAGNTVKSLIIAYCGYLGLGALLRWLG